MHQLNSKLKERDLLLKDPTILKECLSHPPLDLKGTLFLLRVGFLRSRKSTSKLSKRSSRD